jgi:hypothetical protein
MVRWYTRLVRQSNQGKRDEGKGGSSAILVDTTEPKIRADSPADPRTSLLAFIDDMPIVAAKTSRTATVVGVRNSLVVIQLEDSFSGVVPSLIC